MQPSTSSAAGELRVYPGHDSLRYASLGNWSLEWLPIMIITNIVRSPADRASVDPLPSDVLPVQRLPNALRDFGRIVVDSEDHGPLESLWARDEDTEATLERIGGDPRFMRAARMPTTRDHGRLNPLTTITRDAFDAEDRERHTAYCSQPWVSRGGSLT